MPLGNKWDRTKETLRNAYVRVGEWWWQEKKRKLGDKHDSVPIFPLRIDHIYYSHPWLNRRLRYEKTALNCPSYMTADVIDTKIRLTFVAPHKWKPSNDSCVGAIRSIASCEASTTKTVSILQDERTKCSLDLECSDGRWARLEEFLKLPKDQKHSRVHYKWKAKGAYICGNCIISKTIFILHNAEIFCVNWKMRLMLKQRQWYSWITEQVQIFKNCDFHIYIYNKHKLRLRWPWNVKWNCSEGRYK